MPFRFALNAEINKSFAKMPPIHRSPTMAIIYVQNAVGCARIEPVAKAQRRPFRLMPYIKTGAVGAAINHNIHMPPIIYVPTIHGYAKTQRDAASNANLPTSHALPLTMATIAKNFATFPIRRNIISYTNEISMNPTLYRISTTSKDRFVIYAKQPKLVNVQKTHAGKGFRASGRLAYASISTSKIPNTTNV